jgi:hypothetical protein
MNPTQRDTCIHGNYIGAYCATCVVEKQIDGGWVPTPHDGPAICSRHNVPFERSGDHWKCRQCFDIYDNRAVLKKEEYSPYPYLGQAIGKTVEAKQAAYGDSFGKSGAVMSILYPDGIPPSKLDDALTVVRVLDKLFRIATDRDALGESPWRDIVGYGLLAIKRQECATKGESK